MKNNRLQPLFKKRFRLIFCLAGFFVLIIGFAVVPAIIDAFSGKTASETNALLAPAITAILRDTFTDADGDGKAEPGQIVTYTVQITASGEDASGVQFTDTLDAKTTLVPGSVNTTPIARNDSFNAIGNVQMVIPVDGSVLINDSDADGDSFTASAGATSAQGGNVALNSNGSFSYNPPRGFEGTDTFTYTINDGKGGTDTGTVSITVSGAIWFVNNSAAAGGDGRLTNPYNSIAAFQSVNNGTGSNPADNDYIFIYTGGGNYDGSLTLRNNQKIIGQGASASILTISGLATPSGTNQLPSTGGTNPAIVTTAPTTNAVNLGQNNLIRGVTIGNTTGAKLNSAAAIGTLTVGPASGASDVTLNGNGQALNLTGGGMLNGNFAALSSGNSAGAGVALTNINGTLTAGNTSAITNAANADFDINGGAANITFDGTITDDVGSLVSIANTTGGTKIFNGAITDGDDGDGSGISLSSNTGATIRFAGGVLLSTGTNAALAATGGGTIEICDENPCNNSATGALINKITTTTGTALNVTGTTIGANNLEFRSVSANGGSTTGITLNNTGSFGGMKVKGTGSAGSGGTIANKTGSDGSTTAGIGIYLENTRNVSLNWMQINDHQNFAIRGNNTVNFTLANSVISGTNGTNESGPYDEGSIYFTELTGAASIADSNISGARLNNIRVLNTSGTLDRIIFNNVTIGANSSFGAHGIILQPQNSAVMKATIQNSRFTSARDQLFMVNLGGSATADLVFTGNTLSNNHPNIVSGGGGMTVTSGGSVAFTPTLTYSITNNSFRDSDGSALLISKLIDAGNFSGTISGNTIGVAAVANSGSKSGSGIRIISAVQGTNTVSITNNQIRQYNGTEGILLMAGGIVQSASGTTTHNAALNATITGNTISNPGSLGALPIYGIHLNSGTNSNTPSGTPDAYQVCTQISGNTITGSGAVGGTDFILRQRFSTTVRLPSYAGGSTDTGAVVSFIQGNNPGIETGNASVSGSGGGFVGGASCAQPTLAFIESSSNNDNMASNFDSGNSGEIEIQPDSESSVSKGLIGTDASNSFTNFGEAVQNTITRFSANASRQFAFVASNIQRFDSLFVTKAEAQSKKSQRNEAQASPEAGETISKNLGLVPAGKTVTITYQVTIADPAAVSQISTQGTVSGGNFANKLTDDPDTAATNDATVTLIDKLDSSVAVTANPTTSAAGQNVTFTATVTRASGTGGTPSGTVQFKDNGVNLGAAQPLDANGIATLSTSALTAGSHSNITAEYSGDAAFKTGTGTLSTSVTVVAPPIIGKAFSPTSIQLNEVSTLTFTITNPSANTVALSGIAFNDAFPSGLEVDASPAATNTCGGTFAASAAAASVNLTGGTLAVNGSCTLSVKVKGVTAGAKNNTTDAVTSSNGGTGNTAAATLTVNQPNYSVAGTVSYGTTPAGDPAKFVSDVLLTAAGTPESTATTDPLGKYSLGNLGAGPYTVTPSKSAQTDNTGISVQDASETAKIAFNINTAPTNNQRTAADATGDGTVSVQDASEIAKRALNITSTNIVGNWKFAPASREYPSLNSNLTGQNYDAILVGDVTGNWTPPSSMSQAEKAEEETNDKINEFSSSAAEQQFPVENSTFDSLKDEKSAALASITVSLPNTSGSAGTTVLIPVTVGDLTGQNVTAYDLNVSFDPTVLEPASPAFDTAGTLTSAAGGYSVFVDPTQPAGRLRVGAFGTTALSGQGTLIYLRFNVLAGAATTSPLNFVQFKFGEGRPQDPQAATTGGSFTRLGPTAATVTITGRVSTTTDKGINRAKLALTNQFGETRFALTNPFGYYHFEGVSAGETYFISVSAKGFTFAQSTMVLNINEAVENVDFVGEKQNKNGY
jgi:uncharacterized repeat protein (TIGR01451 family)